MTEHHLDDLPASEVLARLRRASALASNPSETSTWSFSVAQIKIRLPNFSWRRRAIDRHDLHHVLLNQPCTLRGECQVATWEFAAGAWPDIRPQLFCCPLVALGFLITPRGTWRTFRAGRSQRSLYALTIDSMTRLGDLRAYIEAGRNSGSAVADGARFAILVGASFCLMLTPLALVVTFLI